LRAERLIKAYSVRVVLVNGPGEAWYALGEREIAYSVHQHPTDTFPS
jgi:hypothetical protein